MNIRSRILKVAKKILSNTNFTSMDDFYEYIENHETRPDTKFTVNGVPVTNPNQGKNQSKNRRTTENKKIIEENKMLETMNDEQRNLHEVYIFGNEDHRCDVAVCIETHPYTLHLLSDDKDELVRKCVACNPKTSTKTLKKLSEDKDNGVREYVAYNPNTPPKILKKLSEDNDENVSSAAKETLLTRKKSMKK